MCCCAAHGTHHAWSMEKDIMQPAEVVRTERELNPLGRLEKYGQSVWLDYLRRSLISSGELRRLVNEDGLKGVTTNPSIFEKAITGSADYRDLIESLNSTHDLDAKFRYEKLAVRDIQDAADILLPVYEGTRRRDGYVSLEVSPYLAHDVEATVAEGRRLAKAVGRENLMIKVPATREGIVAIERLISEGISVNATLLFSQSAYEQVAEAYISGLEQVAAWGDGDVRRISSVASFFISRIDSSVDHILTERLKATSDAREAQLLKSVIGKVAIANAKLAYQRYLSIFNGPRWQALADKGARPQRVLWASTGTKNPNYRDVLYVEELIGADTVNTIPPATLDAFRDHGLLRNSLMEDLDDARRTMANLAELKISMEEITDKLRDDGVRQFVDAFDKLLEAVEQAGRCAVSSRATRQTYSLPQSLEEIVKTTIDDWRAHGKVRRLWHRDATLWTGTDEANWLGWLGITEDRAVYQQILHRIAEEVRNSDFSHILLLGMGGSSLCPEVLKLTFGKVPGFPEMHVLDSTHPVQVRSLESKIDLTRSLFIVSSKSGGTLEPNIFKQYFFERVQQQVGSAAAGSRFIAITDPGSKMQQVAEASRFRHVFHGVPSIGGRYSALSNFGMVPAAAIGIDTEKFLDRAEEMVEACASCVPVEENPGAVLGIILGAAAQSGFDKLTIIASPAIAGLGAWLEQLLAESTGKRGKGIIPVDREQLGQPEAYGADRIFAYIRLESAPDAEQDAGVEAFERAGKPVVRISVGDIYDLGQEFFRWEVATAVAGSILGINAFDQPDVEASKIATRCLTAEFENSGSLPVEKPMLEEDGIELFADEMNARALAQLTTDQSLTGYLRAHLSRISPRDYFALLGYIPLTSAYEELLQEVRHVVRDRKQVATCVGFGPRFLHSTGQAYKGGANTGVFLQITCKDTIDLPVPQQKYTFGIVKAAQARGDFQVLAERKRRVLKVHLATDLTSGLAKLREAIGAALG